MTGILYYIFRASAKFKETYRCFYVRHANKGSLLKAGKLVLDGNVSVLIREGGSMSTGAGVVSIRQGSRVIVENGACLKIGDDVGINANCYIAVHEEVIIGDNTILGPGVVVVDQDHDYKAEGGLKSEKYLTGRVKIGNNVWIGANAVILRNTTIGDNAVIGAGSVVSGNVPEGTVFVNKRQKAE